MRDIDSGRSSYWDDDSSIGQTITATAEEIRYAYALRLALRESYQRQPVPPPTLWWVGAD